MFNVDGRSVAMGVEVNMKAAAVLMQHSASFVREQILPDLGGAGGFRLAAATRSKMTAVQSVV